MARGETPYSDTYVNICLSCPYPKCRGECDRVANVHAKVTMTSEEKRQRRREYYQTNKKKILAQQRKYQQANKEKIKAYQREYHQTKKEVTCSE